MKKLLAFIVVVGLIVGLTLVLTTPPITSGTIINKYVDIRHGMARDTTSYYLVIQDRERRSGNVQVTQQAWNQAAEGMKWPFEIK